jgi:hypothetical protein
MSIPSFDEASRLSASLSLIAIKVQRNAEEKPCSAEDTDSLDISTLSSRFSPNTKASEFN